MCHPKQDHLNNINNKEKCLNRKKSGKLSESSQEKKKLQKSVNY